MSEYQYPLYFEANDLTDREKERVWRHFQKRRESGGGDCSSIERVEDKVYKVCFEEAEAQERVLQRKFHTISLPSRELCLTVSQTKLILNLDQSSAKQTQASTTSNTKCLEKIFKLEIFLLYYLRDNLKASKVLRKQLDAINCTVEFNNEEEEAVVRGNIDKGSGGDVSSAAENWEIQVDKVFISFTERYLCYHAVEPKLGKMLQDISGAFDDINVYTENGYHVVVGEKVAVEEKIDIAQKKMTTSKEVPVVEKHFKLVEEEFSREARANFPEVKISRRDGMVTLEGPPMAVQAGVSKLDELIQKIQKKRVPLDSALLSFMRLSGADSKYQTRFRQSLRHPVALELGTDLLLSSLSSDALNEAEAALQRDLSVARVVLQGAEVGPPDLDNLKQIMTTAKNQANSREYRADVSFTPGLGGTSDVTVQLVGYTENVNGLKETLHDFQMNHVVTQETLNLPHPDMVDCFDKILNLIGMTQTEVTISASPFPYPCVLLSGPRCEVQKVQASMTSILARFTLETLNLEGPWALQYFQGDGRVNRELIENNCHVIIKEQGVNPPNLTSTARFNISPKPHANVNKVRTKVSTNIVIKPSLEIKIGNLEDEQANVLVVPMLNGQMNSTNIGKSLVKKGGSAMTSNFDLMASNCVLGPGEVLQVDAPPSLGCSKLFFIECRPWDGVRGQSVQALSQGLKRCLDLCEQQQLHTVAFPVIGPGVVLKFPLSEATQVLTDTIKQFGSSTSSRSLSNIRVVIKPDNPDSEKFYHDIYKHLSSSMNQGGQAIFRSLTSDLDDITTTVGGRIKLQLVFGDITNETTDAVVNTTDFANFHNDGVCKDILTVAGPEVENELKAAKVNRGEIFPTQPGCFPCKGILHVCGERDAGVIEQIVCDIIDDCETSGFTSVAIPAICAGAGGLNPHVVANAILRGVKVATSSTTFACLTNIRLILFKIKVFMAFKKKTLEIYPTAAVSNVPAPLLTQVQQQQPCPVIAELRSLQITPISQNSTFLFMGITRKNVDDAKKMLKDLFMAQCSTQTFSEEDLAHLAAEDLEDLEDLAKTHGLSMQKDQPSQGCITVSGLKDAVSQMRQMVTTFLQSSLRRQAKIKSQEDLYNRVVWCILGSNGNWERLPKKANHDLENKDITDGIEDAHGVSWRVDLQRSEATCPASGLKATLKRLENLSDFTLPLYWDSMAAGENMKTFELQSSSPEYKRVKEAFKRTVNQTVLKIERIQNIRLRHAYETQKKQISNKNRTEGGAFEKVLYHGTTQENCTSIMNTGFNRSFAGQNATRYGQGTYFAVNANYSAQPTYSKPLTNGSQLMFVARVLTGISSQGSTGMKVPPPRSDQQPHDLCDSVVDRMDKPNMFVVFHDDQAYPDYLITFK